MTGTKAPTISPADQAALDFIAAEQAAGRDPFGDHDDDDGAGADTQQAAAVDADDQDDTVDAGGAEPVQGAAEGQPTEEEAAATAAAAAAATAAGQGEPTDASPQGKEATELTAEQLAALASDDDEPSVPVAPAPRYDVKAPADADAKIAELEAKDAAAFKQLLDGQIEAEDYAKVKAETGKEIRQIERAVARAETLAEANEQNAAAEQAAAIDQIKVQAKKVGLDYDTDQKAQRQFNAMVDAVASDPDNANLTPAQIYAEANKAVYALRGLKHGAAPAPAPSPAPAAAPAAARATPPAPPTLRGLPAAAQAQTGGGIDDQLSRLTGVDFEKAYANLSPAQKAALLND